VYLGAAALAAREGLRFGLGDVASGGGGGGGGLMVSVVVIGLALGTAVVAG
jgi:hypothetical protein